MPFSLPGARKKKKEKSALMRPKRKFRDPDGPRPRKAIMQEEDDDDGEYDGMPGLMSVSESSDDEGGPQTDSDSDDDEDEDEEEDESEWEGSENKQMQSLLLEAMREYQRRGGKVPPWTDESENSTGNDKTTGNMKSNPFMKMLRSFAGKREFSTSFPRSIDKYSNDRPYV